MRRWKLKTYIKRGFPCTHEKLEGCAMGIGEYKQCYLCKRYKPKNRKAVIFCVGKEFFDAACSFYKSKWYYDTRIGITISM